MKKKLMMFGVAVASLLILTAGVSATVWHVPEDFLTIQDAIDGATSGDTILVGSDRWFGATVSKAVKIIGEEGSIIDNGPNTHPFLRAGFLFPGGDLGSGATISGFTFEGTEQTGYTDDEKLDFPIFSRGANNVTIKDNVMENSLQAITNWHGSGWQIRNNTIENLWVLCGGGIGIIIGSKFGPPASDNFVGFNQITADINPDCAAYSTPGICLMSDARYSWPGGPVEDNKVLHNDSSVIGSYDDGTESIPTGVGIELTDIGFEPGTTQPYLQGNKVGLNDPSESSHSVVCNPLELQDSNVIRNNPGKGVGHGLPPAAIFD